MSDADYPDSYYAATVNTKFRSPVLTGDLCADVAVVGGGFSGLSAALELGQKGYRVVLLEARRLGWGASGRNGGQLLSGGFGDPGEMQKRYGAKTGELARSLGRECVRLVRERIDSRSIDCDFKTGAFSAALTSSQLKTLRQRYESLRDDADPGSMSWYPRERVHEVIGSERYMGGYLDRSDGHLHPLKLCLAEAVLARENGVEIFEHSPVIEVRHGARPVLRTENGNVTAEFVIVCCNAYLDGLVPALSGSVLPAGSFIIATEPLDDALAARLLPLDSAVADENVLLDYYRLSAEHRVLFGGRYSYRGSAPADISTALRRRIAKVFPALAEIRIDYSWGGKIGISPNRLPQLGRVAPNIYYAQGYSGHGVAQTHMAGKLLAEAIAGQAERFDVYAAIKKRRLPGGNRLAPAALGLALTYFRLRDVIGW